ncbi:hypothetical protein BV25DRAFT_1828613 [Artomyces pyxidatus]|uniref:Uncharacterized protein n=1 Tax=Artomyces pyxidatus TaxID=48021 RepID=A0ACB8SUT7_9AGAM|nr:hypothetical protein BV25DRAFT_1828613 [Artomyces pyxidatus]
MTTETDPVVEIVTFRPNATFTKEPEKFRLVREWVERAKSKGMNGQYWGQGVEKPHNVHWFLLWDSRAAHAVVQAEPDYPAFVKQIEELADGPIRVLHVHFSTHPPTKWLEAPVTEVDIYKFSGDIVEYEKKTMKLAAYIQASHPSGYMGSTIGTALEENGTVGVYMGAWETVEHHTALGEDETFMEMTEGLVGDLTDLQAMHVTLQPHA